MGTISEKLTYLNTTKQKLKDSINALGGDITSETTFRNYATELDNIYSSLPKTTGEGSSLSLTTLKGRINVDDILGDTEQDGTPTPSTPIDIQVVTGTQEVVVQNKNLLPITATTQTISGVTITINSDKTITLNGTSTSVLGLDIGHCALVSGSYKGNCETNATTNTYYIRLGEGEGDSSTWIANATNNTTVTLSEDKNVYARLIIRNGVTLNNVKIYPMIYKGTTSTSYVEHQEQTKTLHLGDIELAKIGTYQDRIYKNNDKWYIEKNIGKVVFNGSETGWGTQNDVFCIEINDILTQSYDERSIIVLSNYFLGAITAYRGGINNLTIAKTIDNGRPKQLGIRYDAFNNVVADFKTWLSTHNTIVYYVLATPTITEITNEVLLQELENLEKLYSYNGTTNITTTSDTGCDIILSVSALKGT